MKAVSLWNLWALLIALHLKKIETRNWQTQYRGPLAIAATKHSPDSVRDILRTEPFFSELCRALGVTNAPEIEKRLPCGEIVAVCDLIDVSRTTLRQADNDIALLSEKGALIAVNESERSFGDYSPGRFAWLLENVRALPEPIPFRGGLGLLDVHPATVREIEAQLKEVKR